MIYKNINEVRSELENNVSGNDVDKRSGAMGDLIYCTIKSGEGYS